MGIHRRRFTPDETIWIDANYADLGRTECARRLGRTKASVGQAARRLCITRPHRRFSAADIIFLRANYLFLGRSECARRLSRSIHSISYVVRKMGLRQFDRWTRADLEFLRDNYKTLGAGRCAQALKRSKVAVKTRAQMIGIATPLSEFISANAWSQAEDDFLRENYVKNGPGYCAQEIKRSKDAVQKRGQFLGLSIRRKA